MADKKTRKNVKTLDKKALKKTKGGLTGGVYVATGDINGDGTSFAGSDPKRR